MTMLGQTAGKPAAVDRAILTLWISIALSVGNVALQSLIGLAPGFALWGLTVIVVLLAAWVIGKVDAGRNWARKVVLIYFVLQVVSTGSIAGMAGDIPLIFVLGLAQAVLLGYATYLTHTPPGSVWFTRAVA